MEGSMRAKSKVKKTRRVSKVKATPSQIPLTPAPVEIHASEPLRPGDSLNLEVECYAERLRLHEEKAAIVASHGPADVEHRKHCPYPSDCSHTAHIRPRRPWSSHTKADLLHLGRCAKADEWDHDSHRLPPRPLQEFCCPLRCFPRTDRRARTECVSISTKVREFRAAEARAFGKSGLSATIVRTSYIDPNGRHWGINGNTQHVADGHHGPGAW
jgi:hypothetical protein